jgi:hypothetical protein
MMFFDKIFHILKMDATGSLLLLRKFVSSEKKAVGVVENNC